MNSVKRILILLFCAYVLVAVLFIVFQRNIIFIPQSIEPGRGDPPADLGKAVKITSEDGVLISGWWIEQVDSKNSPTLLYCHGNGATLPGLTHVAKLFKDYGLNALLFDYRSYGESQKAPLSEEGIMKDARAAYDWIINEQNIPNNRIVIWGHSLGGAVAARLSTERDPAALITEGVFPSIQKMANSRYPWLPITTQMIFDKFETAKYLSIREMPLLMLHAENDNIIPYDLGLVAFEEARAPKEWLILKDISHNDFPSVESLYREKILSFIKKQVP